MGEGAGAGARVRSESFNNESPTGDTRQSLTLHMQTTEDLLRSSLEAKNANAKHLEEEIKSLRGFIRQKELEIAKMQEDHHRSQSRNAGMVENLEKATEKLVQDHRSMSQELGQAEGKLRERDEEIKLFLQLLDKTAGIDKKLRQREEESKEKTEIILALEEKIHSLDHALTNANKSLEEETSKAESFKKEAIQLREALADAESRGRGLTDELQTLRDEAILKLKEKDQAMHLMDTEVKTWRTRLNSVQEERDQHSNKLRTTAADAEELKAELRMRDKHIGLLSEASKQSEQQLAHSEKRNENLKVTLQQAQRDMVRAEEEKKTLLKLLAEAQADMRAKSKQNEYYRSYMERMKDLHASSNGPSAVLAFIEQSEKERTESLSPLPSPARSSQQRLSASKSPPSPVASPPRSPSVVTFETPTADTKPRARSLSNSLLPSQPALDLPPVELSDVGSAALQQARSSTSTPVSVNKSPVVGKKVEERVAAVPAAVDPNLVEVFRKVNRTLSGIDKALSPSPYPRR